MTRIRVTEYVRVGSASAPSNTTAGDLTAVRIFVSGNSVLGGTTGLSNVRVLIDGSVTNDSAFAFGMYMGGVTLVLTGNGRTGIGFYAGGVIATSAIHSGLVAYAGYLEAQTKTGDGVIATATGLHITKPTIGTANYHIEASSGSAEVNVAIGSNGYLPILVDGVARKLYYT